MINFQDILYGEHELCLDIQEDGILHDKMIAERYIVLHFQVYYPLGPLQYCSS